MKSGHHGMDSLRVGPDPPCAKIGYQGDQNRKVSEGPMPALVPYFGPVAQLGERLTCNQEDWVQIPPCPRRILYFDVIKSTGG